MSTRSNPFLRPAAWAIAPIALITAALIAPYFSTHGFYIAALLLQRGFALVCHQRPERSFWIFGAPVAVCARCLGIYFSAAIGLLLRTSRQLALRLLVTAAALNLFDAFIELAGLHGNWKLLRFGMGLLLGVAGALLISSTASPEVRLGVDQERRSTTTS